MPKQHTIEGGDSTESVAYDNGLFWETVWNHPQNARLRELRKEPNILEEGDELFVPDKRIQQKSGSTDARHRFRRKGVPSLLQVRLLDQDKPRVGIGYKIAFGKRSLSGKTDGDGWIRVHLMPDVTEGVLTLATGEVYTFDIGTVRPMATLKGVQGRLRNLGFFHGPIDGEMSDALQEALRLFQLDQQLTASGEADAATRAKLLEVHGS